MSFVIRDYVCIFSRSRHIRMFNLYTGQRLSKYVHDNKGEVTEKEMNNFIETIITPSFNNHIKEKLNPYLEQELSKYIHDNKGQVTEEDMDNFLVQRNIIFDFENNVKGKKFTNTRSTKFCGDEGHWLERQFGVKTNNDNAPDLDGWEMKKESDKISFGDWRASWYLYENDDNKMTRINFIQTFGSYKNDKNRYSWSGKVFPKYGIEYNYAGQRIRFLDNEDLVIEYSYSNDTREMKFTNKFHDKEDPVIIACWEKSKLQNHVQKKFGVKGFFICKKNKQKVYDRICFGKTIDFKFFKVELQKKNILLDSGMYQGNSRPYSQFRANKILWDTLITEEY